MSTADAPLTVFEREAVQNFVAHYPNARAACVEAMTYLQKGRRYISDAVLCELAPILRMSAAELDEVATFYNLIFRRPVGENVLLLCDSVTCWMLGRDKLAGHVKARLGIAQGETTADGRVTLLPIVCLGACDKAPAMMVGEEFVGDLTIEKLDVLLDAVVPEGVA
jgi:NADH-quinone oxidoreductase subunit E